MYRLSFLDNNKRTRDLQALTELFHIHIVQLPENSAVGSYHQHYQVIIKKQQTR